MTTTSFVLSEEQEALRKTARAWARERAPIAHLRHLRDSRDPDGFSRELWRDLAQLGFAGLTLQPDHGGSGLGFADLGLLLEELGRTLAPTPLLSTLVLGASALQLGGSRAQQDEHLPAVASGDRILALAHDEGRRHLRSPASTRLEKTASGRYRLAGQKVMALDGHVADFFVVSALTDAGRHDAGLKPGAGTCVPDNEAIKPTFVGSGETGPGVDPQGALRRQGLNAPMPGAHVPASTALVLVPATAPGVSVTRTRMVDSRNADQVRFDGVEVGEQDLLAAADPASVLGAVLDRGAIALTAEMLGGALEVFDRTVAYLKDRKQFGVPIGSFQALKHRAALLYCELELGKSVSMAALRAVDAGEDAARMACAAKARMTDAFLLACNEGVQMHGGIGVTDECDVGLFLKRARVCEMLFGDASFHRNRYADLLGY